MTTETYRIEIEDTQLGTVHGSAVPAIKATLYAIRKDASGRPSYRFIEDAECELFLLTEAGRDRAIANACRLLRAHCALRRCDKRTKAAEAQAAFMSACGLNAAAVAERDWALEIRRAKQRAARKAAVAS